MKNDQTYIDFINSLTIGSESKVISDFYPITAEKLHDNGQLILELIEHVMFPKFIEHLDENERPDQIGHQIEEAMGFLFNYD